MPQDNGRIYIETENGVKKGVSLDDIGSAIGSGSRDLGTLCTHENINIWAKYKPMVSMNDGGIGQGFHGVLSESDRKNVNYGFNTPPQTSSRTTMMAFYDSDVRLDGSGEEVTDDQGNSISDYHGDVKMNGWVYNVPSGGNEPFRALDFIDGSSFLNPSAEEPIMGYDHNAVPPISGVSVKSMCKNTSNALDANGIPTVFIDSTLRLSTSGTETNEERNKLSVKLSDLSSNGVGAANIFGCYYGLLLVGDDGYVIATSEKTVGEATVTSDDDDFITLGLTTKIYPYNFPIGDYDVYPFLTNTRITNTSGSTKTFQLGTIGITSSGGFTTNANSGTLPSNYFTIIGAQKMVTKVYSSDITVSFRARKEGDRNIKYTISIHNDSSSSKTLEGLILYLLPSTVTSVPSDQGMSHRYTQGGGASGYTITIASNGTFSYTYTFTVTNTDLYKTGKAWVYLGGSYGSYGPFRPEDHPILPPEEFVPKDLA